MLSVGTVLNDNYRIERLLGRGGTARVYLATNIRLPTQYAIKVLSGQYSQDPSFLRRFRLEADILARLVHPHLVRVWDWNETLEGEPYLVMELLTGMDLAALLTSRGGSLSVPEVLSIFRQAADAISAAHAKGVIHRDLKPSNLFICTDGPFENFVKVLDFGIAKLTQDASSLGGATAQASLIGTPAYMSPEQAQSRATIDGRSDQFSLAVVLYEMLSGRSAFQRPEDLLLVTLHRVVSEELPPLSDKGQSSPQLTRLDPVLQRALSKDPERRFESIAAFLAAVLEAAAEPQAARFGTGSRPFLFEPAALSGETLDTASAQPVPRRASRLLGPVVMTVVLTAMTTAIFRAYFGRSRAPSPSHAPRVAASMGLPSAPIASVPDGSARAHEPSGPEPKGAFPGTPEPAVPMPPPPRAMAAESVASPLLRIGRSETAGRRRLAVLVRVPTATKVQRDVIVDCVQMMLQGMSEQEQRRLASRIFLLGGWTQLQLKQNSVLPAQYRNAANSCLKRAAIQLPPGRDGEDAGHVEIAYVSAGSR